MGKKASSTNENWPVQKSDRINSNRSLQIDVKRMIRVREIILTLGEIGANVKQLN